MMLARVAGVRLALLGDGALCIEGARSALRALAHWLPACATPAPRTGRPPALIRLGAYPGAEPRVPEAPPTLRLAGASAWPLSAARWLLQGPSGAAGRLELDARRAWLHAPTDAPDLAGMAGIAAALLLGRLSRALLHAAAAGPAAGGAWLLVGDSGSGKSTTTRTLADAGWTWLADDHAVLDREAGAPAVEGWPRGSDPGDRALAEAPAHPLDPTPSAAAWRRRAPLAGVLLPVVRPDGPTAVRPARPAEALAALVRQSPWLLADAAAAPALLRLMTEAAQRPAFHLALGRDCLRSPERLTGVLAAAGIGGCP